MNGEFLRGEVYWVSLDDAIGGEEKTGRPAVIVSTNGLNAMLDVVTVAYVSRSASGSPNRPTIADANGGRRRVLCDQLRTVDKSRLTAYDTTLANDELIRVTGALACTFGIPIPRPEGKTIIPAVQKESDDDLIASMRCEVEMWRKMYELTMDQLVELRVGVDLAEKTEPKESHEIKSALPTPDPGFEEEPVPEQKPEKPKKKAKPQKEPKVGWDGVKVNINTVPSGAELKKRTGMSRHAADEIIRTRKIVGKYEKVEDLLALDHFGELTMKRYGFMLTVEDSPEGEPEGEDNKKKNRPRVNVNTATHKDLMAVGFSSENAAKIRRWVREYGPFESVDDLTKVDTIRGKALRKIRDNLEV